MEPVSLLLSLINAAVILVLLIITSSTLWYPWYYRKMLLPRYSPEHTPSIALFLPCKGADRHFADNIQSTLAVHYPHFHVYFIVESSTDPAHDVIKKIIAHKKHATLVIAGHAVNGGQKNHNLVAGVAKAGKAYDVFVFMDSDIAVTERWLRDLMMPLSDPRVTVSTGGTWLALSSGTIGERAHTFMIAVQRALLHFPPFKGIWGGCNAIRRADFEKLNIASLWEHTVSDDMQLEAAMIKHNRSVVLVPECRGEGSGGIQKLSGAFHWITRQTLMIKYYLRPMWTLAYPLFIYLALMLVAAPGLIAWALVSHEKIAVELAACCVLSIFGLMCVVTIMRLGVHDNHSKIAWFCLSPVTLLITLLAAINSGFHRTIHWSSISYNMAFDGTVRKVIR